MITVIIAGGSGTRLWPLSTNSNPKQLLKLTNERSMVQNTYDRATQLGDTVYVVTEASHADALQQQLPELSDEAFLVEPGRRGTAHCIIFALDYIARHHEHNEPIAFVHSDHNVRDIAGFARSFKAAGRMSVDSGHIALIGIEPTYPATGFEYIERGEAIDELSEVYDVNSFRERGDYETMRKYVEAGNFLWNCGYFVGTIGTFLGEMEQYAPELWNDYSRLAQLPSNVDPMYTEVYLSFDTDAIDFALIKKVEKLVVVQASFDWMDIGNFKDLHDVVPKDKAGNYISGENVHMIDIENSYIRNDELDKPIAVIGLDNVVVVNTPDGILVARKDLVQKVGDIAKKIQAKD